MSYVKIGVAGPVGSGKTALIEALTRRMAKDYSIGVITNDIYNRRLSSHSDPGRRFHESGSCRRNGGKISGY